MSTMEARLSAVQKRLVLLLLASLAVAILARPQPDNGRFTAALDELTPRDTRTRHSDGVSRSGRGWVRTSDPIRSQRASDKMRLAW